MYFEVFFFLVDFLLLRFLPQLVNIEITLILKDFRIENIFFFSARISSWLIIRLINAIWININIIIRLIDCLFAWNSFKRILGDYIHHIQ